jgi:hypothetical protein
VQPVYEFPLDKAVKSFRQAKAPAVPVLWSRARL